ncbi:hypothetical protein F9L00_16845 [Brucella anthropi]|uniref:hypothetical protein n=1 Tax=Brucella/Ochrobactrum group TaxID=2826938 RepID=UPI00124E5F25|nr:MULTISPECIES: hypothetical protein [Brucella/Ochrobactrum group]KAB2759538.1 hypothetical protein F9K98_21080 [Brucella anthropi]KAB2775335.1 hypothetical protein F9L00_16845 [Brucella anthropi]MCQ9146903.1 hypothetical protein [Ochrobactrum sp. BTU2]UGQ20866.1 hypothetical protein LRL11_12360 [Brucella anthropi]
MQSGFSVDHGKLTKGYQQLTVMTSLQDRSCQKGSLSCSPNIMNVAHMKLVSPVFTVLAITLCTTNASMAAQANVHLFLDAPTAETTIDAMSASFRSELVDKDLKERSLTERPRLMLACNDKQLQTLHLSIPEDLNPWSAIKDEVRTTVEVKSVTGIEPFTGNLIATPLSNGLSLSMDIRDKAGAIGRSWYEGMPITLSVPSKNNLPDLNIVLFGAEPTRHFKSEISATIKVCEFLSSS